MCCWFKQIGHIGNKSLDQDKSDLCAVIPCILLLCPWVLLVTDMLLTVEITWQWYVMIINNELGRSHGLTSVYYAINCKDARRGSLSDVRILVHTVSVSLKYRSAVWSVMRPVLVISWFHVDKLLRRTFLVDPLDSAAMTAVTQQFLAFVICSCLTLMSQINPLHIFIACFTKNVIFSLDIILKWEWMHP
jgi:hypothetical protein